MLATLLLDLLSPAGEEEDAVSRAHRFDVGMLAVRLVAAIDWLRAEADTCDLPVGLFGASTRGGAALPGAEAPTLLIVGGATHLFEEPGVLDRVAALAREWFLDRLA